MQEQERKEKKTEQRKDKADAWNEGESRNGGKQKKVRTYMDTEKKGKKDFAHTRTHADAPPPHTHKPII